MRQVARQRDEPVVRLRIDGDGNRAKRAHEAVERAVARRIGGGNRRQKPRCAPEQLPARVLGPARLGAAHRMTADEPRIAHRASQGVFRRADVGDRRPVAARFEHRSHLGRQRGNRRGDDRELGAGDRGTKRRSSLHCTAFCGGRQRVVIDVPSADVRDACLARRQPHRRADQARADHGEAAHGH
jgi:hypothetical protein